jgi:hippurate hydrolase
MKIRSLPILLLSILPGGFAFAQQTPQTIADAELPSLLAIYKDIHSHPELSWHEERTSALIARELRAAGCEVTENFGKYDTPNLKGYGVIGFMKNGDGPTVLVRTDMDALPVEEETGLPYASKVVTKNDERKDVHVAQACGHEHLIEIRENDPDRNYDVRDQRSIVSFDRPFDNLGFLSEKFRQMLLYVVRS